MNRLFSVYVNVVRWIVLMCVIPVRRLLWTMVDAGHDALVGLMSGLSLGPQDRASMVAVPLRRSRVVQTRVCRVDRRGYTESGAHLVRVRVFRG